MNQPQKANVFMQKWLIVLLGMALAPLKQVAQYLRDEDADNIGWDDAAGIALEYACNVIQAILDGKPTPTAPAALQ